MPLWTVGSIEKDLHFKLFLLTYIFPADVSVSSKTLITIIIKCSSMIAMLHHINNLWNVWYILCFINNYDLEVVAPVQCWHEM